MPIEKDNFFDILNQYVKKVIKPNFNIGNAGISRYSRLDDSNHFTGQIALPSLFSEYKQTDYYYRDENEKFIHFTSLNTFIKIIDSGHFLASQLTYHDDPLEFIYASNEMSSVVRKETLTYLKKFLFSLSMCVYEEGKDSFDIWRLYGDSGNGVGIVFSFYDNKDKWRNSFLSPVYYGNNNKVSERFKRFSDDHIIFMKEHPKFTLQSDFWREPGIPNSIALFLAFHKNPIFHTENEVRFLKSFLTGDERCNGGNELIGIILDKKNAWHYTYKIPLVSERNILINAKEKSLPAIQNFSTNLLKNINIIDEYVGDSPFIIIEKVILGYRYTQDDLSKIKRTKLAVESKLNGKPINFELSHLSNKFHGQ